MHEYELAKFIERSYGDGPNELMEVISGLPFALDMKTGPWIAGGAIRRALLGQGCGGSDIDLFFANSEQLAKSASQIEGIGGKVARKTEHATDYALTIEEIEYRIQFIGIAFYESPAAILDSFDFTICQFVTDGNRLGVGEYALWDLARKRLVLHKLTYAVASMRRFLKYTKQGFTACTGMMASFLEAVVRDPAVVKADIKYID